jgi:Ca2+-binding RTX toxin-like protein
VAGTSPGTIRRRATAVAVAAVSAAVLWSLVPEGAEARPKCGGRKATIVRGGGDNVIKAPKKGVQVIVAGGGNDVIVAKRNKDIICGGDGDDTISGGTGRDRIFGGPGNDLIMADQGSDKVFAGPGDDTILGGGGGDRIHGEDGADRILGELQDDRVFGGPGNDVILGGHGIDRMDGGSEDDWLRGEVNRDSYTGGPGNDTASFATATPPGPTNELDGIAVSLGSGAAAGDDSAESIGGIENVIGSQFNDQLNGPGGLVQGGAGRDACSGFTLTDCGGVSRATATLPLVFVADGGSPDPGLVVLGGTGDDNLTAILAGGVLTVSGSPMLPGPGCNGQGATTLVTCPAPPVPLGYVLLWGDAGNDTLSLGGGLSQLTEVKGDGGPGNDQLTGGPGADILYPGETGSDRLIGGDGDDALIGRGGGGDVLEGQGGSDNLVSNNPCDGHTYIGGPGGADVAGFGHVTIGGVLAKLNGKAMLRGSDGGCNPTKIRGSEVLEGAIGNDKLIGTKHFDLLIGREGNDVLIGKGGRDDFRGDAGKDRCIGKGQKRSC